MDGYPLHTAVRSGDLGQIKDLLKHKDVNEQNSEGKTPISLVDFSSQNAKQIVWLLLSRGAKPTDLGSVPDEFAPIVFAFSQGFLNEQLMLAVRYEDLRIAREIVDKIKVLPAQRSIFDKVEVLSFDENKNTQLALACKLGNVSLVNMLLELKEFKGVKNQFNADQQSPIEIALFKFAEDITRAGNLVEVVKTLLDHGVNHQKAISMSQRLLLNTQQSTSVFLRDKFGRVETFTSSTFRAQCIYLLDAFLEKRKGFLTYRVPSRSGFKSKKPTKFLFKLVNPELSTAWNYPIKHPEVEIHWNNDSSKNPLDGDWRQIFDTADIQGKYDGFTPLHFAVGIKIKDIPYPPRPELLKYLLYKGADPNIKTDGQKKMTPLDLAVKRAFVIWKGTDENKRRWRDALLECVKLLCFAGAKVQSCYARVSRNIVNIGYTWNNDAVKQKEMLQKIQLELQKWHPRLLAPTVRPYPDARQLPRFRF